MRWLGRIGWRRQLPIIIAVTGLVLIAVLTPLGHKLAASTFGVLTGVATIYATYDQRQARRAGEGGASHRGSVVVICHAREDLRWALWLEDRLNAAGYTPRLQQISVAGQDTITAANWADQITSGTTYVVIIISPWLRREDESTRARLAALAQHHRRARVIRIETEPTSGLSAVVGLPAVSIAGIHHHTLAWERIDGALHERGAKADSRRANAFRTLSALFPGVGVISANLPMVNPNFVGRAPELARLRRDLIEAAGGVSQRSLVIHAMSGMGKTQLATRFASELRELDFVWWIHAHQPGATFTDLASLAAKLGITNVADQNEMLRLLWDRLRTYEGRWLLVYDNAESEEKLQDLIPPDGDGSLLITSQSPNWASRVRLRMELDHMSEADAVELLRKRVSVRDDAVLVKIAEKLGWLPLSLEQAASYMRETQCNPARYLDQLTRRFSETLERGTQAYYDKSATTTYRIAREQTAKIEPLSGTLLELCGFFSPDAIPRDLFEDPSQMKALPAQLRKALSEGIPYDAAVSAARKFSLLGVTPSTFTMHRVVQQLIRDSLTPQLRDEHLNTAARLLEKAFPPNPNDPRTWETCGALQSHCVTVLDEIENHDLASAESIRLSRLIGEYELVRGAFESSLKRLRKTLVPLQAHDDAPEERIATELALSRGYYQLPDLRQAEKHARAALLLDEATLNPAHRTTAAILRELSKIQLELTEFDAARKSATRSLAINRAQPTAVPDLVGQSLETLGVVQWRLGEWEQAEANLQESVLLLEESLGPQSGVTAHARTCWGLVLRDSAARDIARLERAEQQFQLSYTALLNAHGPDHPDTCAAAIHLADTQHRRAQADYAAAGDSARLNEALTRIADEFDRIMARPPMSAQKPSRACGLVRQGHLLNNLGDHGTARRLVNEARGIYIQSYDAEHPYVAEALTRLIGIEYDLGNPSKADQFAQEARGIYVRHYGERHPYVVQIDAFRRDPAAGRD